MSESPVRLRLEEASALAADTLRAVGVPRNVAQCVASDLVEFEALGNASHGLARLPKYVAHAARGKVRARAEPSASLDGPLVRVDAGRGFAAPAIALARQSVAEAVRHWGIACAAVFDSHHGGGMGLHCERLAETGVLALAFANAPAAIAPWGGRRAVFGTNPIAFACPRREAPPIVVDGAMAATARGKVALAALENRPLERGLALDEHGRATTDARAALAGTLLGLGGAKGSAFALMVELLAGALTGSGFGHEATPFEVTDAAPPRLGQLFIVFDPERLAGPSFASRVELLARAATAEPGTRLPGADRPARRAQAAREGVLVPGPVMAELRRLGRPHSRRKCP